jgi:hypothetical protein
MNKIANLLRDKDDAKTVEDLMASVSDNVFPVKGDQVQLRLVKTHDKEIICDQDGRELVGVIGFRYEQIEVDSLPQLTVMMKVNWSEWTPKLGVIEGGEKVDVKPSPFGK